jgi:protein TonB
MNRIGISLIFSCAIHILFFSLTPDLFSAKKINPISRYLTITLSPIAPPPALQIRPAPQPERLKKKEVKTSEDFIYPAREIEKVPKLEYQNEMIKNIPTEIESGNSNSVVFTPKIDEMISKPPITASHSSSSTPLPIREATPAYRKNPIPDYPSLARKKNIEGTVILEVKVNPNGTVAEMHLFQSSGHSILDKAAMNSVRKWIFEPGMKGDEPIPMWVRIPIRFQLEHP